jgi:signal transduction histidine kinase
LYKSDLRQFMPGWHCRCNVICMSSVPPTPRDPSPTPEHPLARAFASFTEAAGSLERTYGQLQGQVTHLRQELEVTNRDLATSLEENHRMRERLRRILEGLPCGVLVMEGENLTTTLNPEAVRLIGGKVASVDALPEPLSAALDRARRTGEEIELPLFYSSLERPDLRSDRFPSTSANPLWVAIRHAWLEQSTASATSIFILRDISETKNLEQEREQLRRQQALVEVSALLAHEIRNPLGSLELFAGLLAEANIEGDSRRWIEHVQAGLRTLSATVNNVLHLHNAPRPELAETDAGELLDWAYGFLMPLAKQARVEMQVVNGLTGVIISADRHGLEQVLLNLALNAFRFMPGGGWLCIEGIDNSSKIRSTEDRVEIVVRDTGPGIAPDDLPHIFDAGFSTRTGSSGLGLAVCHRILEQHGGSISAESRYGYGATFRLRVPCTAAAEAVHLHDELSPHPARDFSLPASPAGANL